MDEHKRSGACVYAQNGKYFKIYGLRDAIIISISNVCVQIASKCRANGQPTTPREKPPTYKLFRFIPFRSVCVPSARVHPPLSLYMYTYYRIRRLHLVNMAYKCNICVHDAIHIDRPNAHIVYAVRGYAATRLRDRRAH